MELTPEQLKEAKKQIYRDIGLKGGPARAAKLSPERRREIAAKAGRARGKQKTAEKKARLAQEKLEREHTETDKR